MTTAILVDDHEITRLGLRKALESVEGLSIIGETDNGHDAVELAIRLKPDLVFMDIGLPEINGIEATTKIVAEVSSKIMIVSSHDSEVDVVACLAAGAHAYCLKDVSIAALSTAIISVMSGALWVDPRLARCIGQKLNKSADILAASNNETSTKDRPTLQRELSEREMQVLALLFEGYSNKQIAVNLFLSEDTIKTHMRHLMEKLNVSDRTQAVVKALKLGLISVS